MSLSRAQLERENAILKDRLSVRRGETLSSGIVDLGRHLFKWGGMCFIAWCFYLSVAALAGQNTIADIRADITADISTSAGIRSTNSSVIDGVISPEASQEFVQVLVSNLGQMPWLFLNIIVFVLLVIYAMREQMLRKSTVKRLQDRIVELETNANPNRTSSNLTDRGNTNPRDK